MAEALVIRYSASLNPDQAPQAQWMLVDAHHNRMGAVVTGSLHEASALAANRKVLAVVNGSSVLHTEPVLPPLKGNTKLQQVVPFALEDQLATDVEELHFAIGKRGDRPGTPVAVVAHQQIQQWIADLQSAGLYPTALITDTASVPVNNDEIAILIDNGRVIARRADAPPTSLDISPLNEALQLLIPQATESAVSVYLPEAEYDQHQASIESLRERAPNLSVKLLPEGALPLFAVQALQHNNLNLLQGVYEPKRDRSNELKPWRTATIFITILFCLNLVVTGTRWIQLKRQEAKLDQQIAETFTQGMPGVTNAAPAQARRTFESRLLALQSTGTNSQLLQTLSALSDAVSKTPNSEVQDISYQENIVNLRVLTASVDSLDQIRKLVAAHGLSTDIQSANPRDNRIEGRLQIKSAGAK